MAKRIMTDEQLLELHDDIRDGVSMIVAVDHYYQLQAENEKLKIELKNYTDNWDALAQDALNFQAANANLREKLEVFKYTDVDINAAYDRGYESGVLAKVKKK